MRSEDIQFIKENRSQQGIIRQAYYSNKNSVGRLTFGACQSSVLMVQRLRFAVEPGDARFHPLAWQIRAVRHASLGRFKRGQKGGQGNKDTLLQCKLIISKFECGRTAAADLHFPLRTVPQN